MIMWQPQMEIFLFLPVELRQSGLKFRRKILDIWISDHGELEETFSGDCDYDQQSEIEIWQPKPEIVISLEL